MNAISSAVEIIGSQKKLADHVGVTQQSISSWLTGKNRLSNPIHAILIEKSTSGTVSRNDLMPDFDWETFYRSLN